MSTELDMSGYTGHKPSEPCVDSLTSGWSSVTASDTTIPTSLLSDLDGMKLEKGRLERYAADAGDLRHVSLTSGWSSVTASDTTIPTSLLSDLNSLKLEKGRLEAHVISLREKIIATTLEKIESSKNVDFCYVLDCTGSMSRHISAAKDCIVQVVNYMERTNPSIKIRIGFCGYRDHCDGDDRIQIFDFTDSHEEFRSYISSKVPAKGGGDGPEDVLGGLNAAITQMNWRNTTRILFHVGDYPPHGHRFSDLRDDYKKGDPNGLTAESVLEMMRTSNILYFFGKVTHNTDKMLKVFRDIIGEIPVFNFDNVELISKYSQATCSAITSSVTLTSTVDNDLYFLRRKELDINPDEPDWSTLKEQTGTVLYYHSPKTLADIQNKKYFNKSNPVSQNISFKIAPHPFSVGAERYAYFALDVKHEPMKKIVVKEYREIGRKANSVERYLEAVEVSAIARFLSTEFNSAAERVGIHKKVKFLRAKLLRSTIGSDIQYYSVEPNISNIKYKRFNVNSGVITEFHSTLEAFAHFTYYYTEGYLLVYDLQGAELSNKFILTDPAIQCIDSLRFGKTNLGEKGIKKCFLESHKCSSVCKKLGLDVKK